MDKILLVLTGGTIGSKAINGVVDVNSSEAYSIVSLYYKRYGKDVDFDVIQPVNILSENLTYDIWLDLFDALDNIEYKKYDAVIICHGSDTLTYTSAMLGMLYNKVNIPMVLIASNYELANEKSNGLRNLRNAIIFSREKIKGVFVSYENNIGEGDIYLATRIVESDPYLDQYRSFDGSVFGKVIDNKFKLCGKIGREKLINFKPYILKRPVSFDKKVLLLTAYPGLDYSEINLDNYSSVCHYMYHSATACVQGENTNFLNFLERCREKKVKLYIASFKDRDVKRVYESSKEILEKGAIPLFNISKEAFYIKVLINENMELYDIDKNWYFEEI